MKILIIEDDMALGACIIGHIIVTFHGAEYKIARSCKEAINYLHSEEFDLITLDGTLLDGHGRSILNEMTADKLSLTIVYSGEVEFVTEAKQKCTSAILKGRIDELIKEIYKITYSRKTA